MQKAGSEQRRARSRTWSRAELGAAALQNEQHAREHPPGVRPSARSGASRGTRSEGYGAEQDEDAATRAEIASAAEEV